MARRVLRRRPASEYEAHVPVMRAYRGRESAHASAVRVRALRTRSKRRSRRRDQRFRAWTALVCLRRDGAVGPPVETGTRRSDSGYRGLSTVDPDMTSSLSSSNSADQEPQAVSPRSPPPLCLQAVFVCVHPSHFLSANLLKAAQPVTSTVDHSDIRGLATTLQGSVW